jgi:hypothetical protein
VSNPTDADVDECDTAGTVVGAGFRGGLTSNGSNNFPHSGGCTTALRDCTGIFGNYASTIHDDVFEPFG